MTFAFTQALTSIVGPMLRRPRRQQVAALCYRNEGINDTETKVLLVTSRGTKRWILPKGWPIKGKDDPGAAMQEAWEEAGVETGTIDAKPVGSFGYDKTLNTGLPVPIEAQVYRVKVENLVDIFPEAHERERTWVTPHEAASMVQEPGLKSILRRL
jgi:8-oxo-dGTP pyrophosphatase MutT (NUDIX family)